MMSRLHSEISARPIDGSVEREGEAEARKMNEKRRKLKALSRMGSSKAKVIGEIYDMIAF